MPVINRQSITARNGHSIQAAFFNPDSAAKATVLIVPATGVSQGYQAQFAAWLATQGYAVATFDYSGTGLSNNGDVRKLWCVIEPLATRLFGYFPGKRLRKVGDLPRGVMDQQCRWCLDPEYAVGAEGPAVREKFAAVTTPITSLSFADDEYMPARNTVSLHGFYKNAPRVMKRISPQDVGVKRIGHFGFFNARFENALWRTICCPRAIP